MHDSLSIVKLCGHTGNLSGGDFIWNMIRIQAAGMTDHRSNDTGASLYILQYGHVLRDRICPASVVFHS